VESDCPGSCVCGGIVGVLKKLEGVTTGVLLTDQFLRDAALIERSKDVLATTSANFGPERFEFVGSQLLNELVSRPIVVRFHHVTIRSSSGRQESEGGKQIRVGSAGHSTLERDTQTRTNVESDDPSQFVSEGQLADLFDQ